MHDCYAPRPTPSMHRCAAGRRLHGRFTLRLASLALRLTIGRG